jgi:endonuclease/exonuclease/phosphatase family metal-dependent hydrolase
MAKRIKNKLTFFDKLILFFNIISILFLLLSYLAPSISPQSFAFIAVLGFGYQMLFIVNVIFIIYWLFRRRGFVLFSAIAILLGFQALGQNFALNFFKAQVNTADKSVCRILEYNVHEFNSLDVMKESTVAQITATIQSGKPDVVALEEVYFQRSDSSKTVDSLKNALGLKYFYFKDFEGYRFEGYKIARSGSAIFSRYPLVDTNVIDYHSFLNTEAMYADVKFRNKTFRVYLLHLAPVKLDAREKARYLSGKINLGRSSFIFDKLENAFLFRSYQVEKIKANMDSCKYPYIVTGDFNDTPNSYAVNTLSDGLKNAFWEKGFGLENTYFSNFPKLHIDYILVSPQFDVLNYTTIDKKLSDHKPIFSDVKLN